MKFASVCLLILFAAACSKDEGPSATTLITRYKWYSFKATVSTQYDDESNPSSVQTTTMDTCTQKSYYDFTGAGNVTRKLPCLHDEATGTWTLADDSVFVVSIPYRSTNVGFTSMNGPLKLASIDQDEMRTSYFSRFASSTGGSPVRMGTITTTTTYQHY